LENWRVGDLKASGKNEKVGKQNRENEIWGTLNAIF
jgi:hypothetical protein